MHILFVCDGNVARSQESERYFNLIKANAENTASSAGVNVIVGKPIDPLVVSVMAEENISMQGAYRKQLSPEAVGSADVLVSFKDESELPAFAKQAKRIVYWHVDDPRRQNIEFHRRVRNEVKRKVKVLVYELKA